MFVPHFLLQLCTRFPKHFTNVTQRKQNGYPEYHRRDDSCKFVKGNHTFTNAHVVPYNKYLTACFDCHINVEICAYILSYKL